MISPEASAWASSQLAQADPTMPAWVTQAIPTGGILAGITWALKVLLPKAVAFFDRAHALLDRVEKKLDNLDKRDGDAEREELREMLAALRARESKQP
jgi:hypothetical protein